MKRTRYISARGYPYSGSALSDVVKHVTASTSTHYLYGDGQLSDVQYFERVNVRNEELDYVSLMRQGVAAVKYVAGACRRYLKSATFVTSQRGRIIYTYYESGSPAMVQYMSKGLYHRVDGPAIIEYDRCGNLTREVNYYMGCRAGSIGKGP